MMYLGMQSEIRSGRVSRISRHLAGENREEHQTGEDGWRWHGWRPYFHGLGFRVLGAGLHRVLG